MTLCGSKAERDDVASVVTFQAKTKGESMALEGDLPHEEALQKGAIDPEDSEVRSYLCVQVQVSNSNRSSFRSLVFLVADRSCSSCC